MSALVLGIGAGTLLWAVGLSVGRAVVAGIALAAVLLVRRRLAGSRDGEWPEPPTPPGRPGWHGAAQTARLLERATTDSADRRTVLVPRLRRLAVARLRRLPRAPLSEGTTSTLSGARRPSQSAVDAALAELAAPDPDDRSAPRASR